MRFNLLNFARSWNTRYSNSNIICPRYKRETDGGRSFVVTGAKLWNACTTFGTEEKCFFKSF
jgi:hypothetical protein